MALGRGLSRGRHHAISPFFAFQDIITSAISVLIAIILLLAVSVTDSGSTESDPESQNLRKTLAVVLADLREAEANLRILRDESDAELIDPKVLRLKAEALRNELASLNTQLQQQRHQRDGLRANDTSSTVRVELAKKQAAVTVLAAQIDQLKEEAIRKDAESAQLEKALKEAEANRLKAAAKRNEIWLIPEPSRGSKEPILATISEQQITLQKFDGPEKAVTLGDLANDFANALKEHSSVNEYIVFYFKPSGAPHFKALTKVAKLAGFEVGYDAVPEDAIVHFRNQK